MHDTYSDPDASCVEPFSLSEALSLNQQVVPIGSGTCIALLDLRGDWGAETCDLPCHCRDASIAVSSRAVWRIVVASNLPRDELWIFVASHNISLEKVVHT